jgi:hypothetical protein
MTHQQWYRIVERFTLKTIRLDGRIPIFDDKENAQRFAKAVHGRVDIQSSHNLTKLHVFNPPILQS